MKVCPRPAHEAHDAPWIVILPQIYAEEPEIRNPVPDQRSSAFICGGRFLLFRWILLEHLHNGFVYLIEHLVTVVVIKIRVGDRAPYQVPLAGVD